MSKITVRYLKTGKIRDMQKRYADPLVKMKIVEYLTRDIPEAPVFKLTQPQPESPQLDLGANEQNTTPESLTDPSDAPRPRGRRRANTSANPEESAAPAEELQE